MYQSFFHLIKKNLKKIYYLRTNFLSDHGFFNRNLNSYRAKLRDDFDLKKRKECLANFKDLNSNNIDYKTALKISKDLDEEGSSTVDLSSISNDKELLSYLKNKTKSFYDFNEDQWKKAINDELKKKELKDTYGGKIFWLDLYKTGQINNPIVKLCLNETLLYSISKYMGVAPKLEFIRLVMNPPSFKNDSDMYGSRIFHIDTTFKNMVKVFINPFEMSVENGPTFFLHKKYTRLKHFRTFPQPIPDKELELFAPQYKNDLKSTIGKPGKAFIVDVAKCLHQGGRCVLPRALLLISYVSPDHYMTRDNLENSSHMELIMNKHKVENQLVDNFFGIE